MWRLGFFFHDMAFGLLTVFIPLYVVTFQDTSLLGGPLMTLGIMTSVAIFCSIPTSYLWGHLCDKKRRYKAFILLSFGSISIILFLMSLPFAQNLLMFIALYIVMQMLHVAHESPKNVLVTEHYSRTNWERSFGLYEGVTEIGFIAGLAAGMILFASTIAFSTLVTYTFYFCCGLSVVSFVLGVLLITDPIMIFERRLVGLERSLDFAHRSFERSSRLMDGLKWRGSLKRDSFPKFAVAIILYSLASSTLFTPLPIFLFHLFGGQQQYVYLAFILCSIGAAVGYFLIRSKGYSLDNRRQMPRFMFLRSFFVFMLLAVVSFSFFPVILTCVILVGLGFVFSMYYIMMLALSMEIIPQGKAGLFDGMVNLGLAVGAFVGPFLASYFSYLPTQLVYMPIFAITAVLFLVAYIAIKLAR